MPSAFAASGCGMPRNGLTAAQSNLIGESSLELSEAYKVAYRHALHELPLKVFEPDEHAVYLAQQDQADRELERKYEASRAFN